MQCTPFHDLSVGVNAQALSRLLSEWQQTATPEQNLSLRDQGVQHWPYIAASNGGKLDLTLTRKADKEDRTYTVAPFAVQSAISKGSPLRQAFTSPYEGEVLIDLDWRASHWQILAFRSGDMKLQADLRSGDLYTTCFPGVERKMAKMGLNTVLNGGGKRPLVAAGMSEVEAKAFLEQASDLLKNRWPEANDLRLELRDDAVAQGFVTPERRYAGAGVYLMRLEAEALRQACSHPDLAKAGMRVVLPLHDGVLVSAPEGKSEAIRTSLSRLMVYYSTGSADEAKDHTDTWVSAEIKESWGDGGTQLVGNQLRAAALAAVSTPDNAHGLVLAACAMPAEVQRALATHHHASAQGRAYRAAVRAKEAALRWQQGAVLRRTPQANPPVILPNEACNYPNIVRILRGDTALPDLRFNARETEPTIAGERATDTLIRTTYMAALETRYNFLHVAEGTLMSAVVDVAMDTQYDPVLDYLTGLEWDGTQRLATWLQDYCNAQELTRNDNGYGLVKVYSEKWMLSIVARAFMPGAKVDTMLVLMGGQGAKKSTMLKAIAPCDSYAAVQVDPNDKDSVLRASRFAIVEWPELAGASKREQESLKDYFSLSEDRVRPPYGKGDVKIPRRTVFAATTNEDDFLRDSTGSRRYWPVKVGAIDIPGILAVKDQLWAEAVDLYKLKMEKDHDDKWWLSTEQDAERASQAEHFEAADPFAEDVMRCLRLHNGVVGLGEVLDFMDVPVAQRPRLQRALANTLKKLGACRKQVTFEGRRVRKWVLKMPERQEGEFRGEVPRRKVIPIIEF
ncbi:MAG: virulence-associated E family protein [Actinomycetia bacterium]|nr:virulence-associated E family protein [Actinomycetes bacterium]